MLEKKTYIDLYFNLLRGFNLDGQVLFLFCSLIENSNLYILFSSVTFKLLKQLIRLGFVPIPT